MTELVGLIAFSQQVELWSSGVQHVLGVGVLCLGSSATGLNCCPLLSTPVLAVTGERPGVWECSYSHAARKRRCQDPLSQTHSFEKGVFSHV
jgi:hypothetical protein